MSTLYQQFWIVDVVAAFTHTHVECISDGKLKWFTLLLQHVQIYSDLILAILALEASNNAHVKWL